MVAITTLAYVSGGVSGAAKIREILSANRTYYIRANLGRVTVTIASPCVATLNSHGLSANDPVVFSIPEDRQICTMTIASPAVVTSNGHGLSAGDQITFATTGALPTGVTAGTTYFVIATGLTANAFEFSTSSGGAAVNTSGSQSGTHFVYRVAALPTGIAAGTVYYVLSSGLTVNDFQFSTSLGGAAVNTSGSQNGYFTLATGNDSNNGLSATRTGALLTGQAACTLTQQIDTNAFTVSWQYADSTYNDTVYISGPFVGTPGVTLVGNATHITNVLINDRDFTTVYAYNCNVYLSGMRLTSNISYCIFADAFSRINVDNIDFGSATGVHAIALAGGQIYNQNSNYYISGGGGGHIYAQTAQVVASFGRTTFVLNTPAIGTFAIADEGGILQYHNTIDGTATGIRYEADSNAVIDTAGSGPNYFPGNSAGTTSTGGQYI